MKPINPKLALLKGATAQQRKIIDLLTARGTLKASELSFTEIAILRRLRELGATAIDAPTGTWYLSDHWNQVLEANAPTCPQPKPLPLKINTPPPLPDPPKAWKRPPSIYSNRSHDELIDHILKTY